jgi:hypothetical protein
MEHGFHWATGLESLRAVTHDARQARSIVVGLQGRSRRLRELKLTCPADLHAAFWTSLEELAQKAKFMKHLELGGVHFDGVHMDALIQCLMVPSAISKLTLTGCRLNTDAMISFKNFMTTHKNSKASDGSSLCELVMEQVCMDCDDNLDDELGSLFASMFCAQQGHVDGQLQPNNDEKWCSTIGSHVRSLSVSPVCNAGVDFLIILGQNAHRLQLSSLKLFVLDGEECEDLAACIATTLSLQELELGQIESPRPILCSLRSNGTLHTVSIPGEIESRLANGYCSRNRLVGPLLQSLAAAELNENDAQADSEASPVKDRSTKSLFPSLLQSAMQVTATRTCAVLSSLLSIGESIGPI